MGARTVTHDRPLAQLALQPHRCPRCRALLFMAEGQGVIEIKCRRCGYLFRRQLSRG